MEDIPPSSRGRIDPDLSGLSQLFQCRPSHSISYGKAPWCQLTAESMLQIGRWLRSESQRRGGGRQMRRGVVSARIVGKVSLVLGRAR